MKKLLFMLFVTAIVLAVGCQKEESQILNESEKFHIAGLEIKLLEGRLILNSKEDLGLLEKLEVENSSTIKEWSRSIPDFTSSYEAFHGLTEEKVVATKGDLDIYKDFVLLDESNNLNPVVDNPTLKYIVNIHGLIQIEELIYKVYPKKILGIEIEDFYSNGSESFEDANLIKEIVNLKKTVIYSDEQEIETRARLDDCESTYDGTLMKVKGRVEEFSSTFGSDIFYRAETENRRKGAFGFYYANNAELLEQTGEIFINEFPGLGFPIDASGIEVSEIGRTAISQAGISVSGWSTRHDATDNGGESGSCLLFD